jgi:molybdate transport system substrate-binding protein
MYSKALSLYTPRLAVMLSVTLIGFSLWMQSEPTATRETVHIAVASNFQHTLKQLVGRFRSDYEYDVIVSSGATGQLFAQIMQGAPYDIFLAADDARPALLEHQGKAIAGSRLTYAMGILALWYPGAADKPISKNSLSSVRSLALASPHIAPYGRAALETLADPQLARSDLRLLQGENVAQAFHLVQSGNAPGGLIALSLVKQAAIPTTEYWAVPPQYHAPIVQQAVLLKASPGSRAFMRFLQSSGSREIIVHSGYRADGAYLDGAYLDSGGLNEFTSSSFRQREGLK